MKRRRNIWLRMGILLLILSLALNSVLFSRAKYNEVLVHDKTWYMSHGIYEWRAESNNNWNAVTPARGWWAIFLRGGQGGRWEDGGGNLDNGEGGQGGYVYALVWFDGSTTVYCRAGQGGGYRQNRWGNPGGGLGRGSGTRAGANGGGYSAIAYNNNPQNEDDLLAVAGGGGGGGGATNHYGGWGGIIDEVPGSNANYGTESPSSGTHPKYYWTGNYTGAQTKNSGPGDTDRIKPWGNVSPWGRMKGGGFVRMGSQGRDNLDHMIVTAEYDSANGGGGGAAGGGAGGGGGGTNADPPASGEGGSFLRGGDGNNNRWSGGGGGGFWGGGGAGNTSGHYDAAGGGGSSYIKATNNGVRLRTLSATSNAGTYGYAWNYISNMFRNSAGNWTARNIENGTRNTLHDGVVCMIYLSAGDVFNGNNPVVPDVPY